MANRSYLYSTDSVPGTSPREGIRFTGISEWNYDIPLAFRILLSARPRACRSAIWADMPEDLALVGDYAGGVERLAAFLGRIEVPEARPDIEETLAFLRDPANAGEYFLLECAELYDMSDEPLEQQNLEALAGLAGLEAEMEEALAGLRAEPTAAPGLLGRLFGAKRDSPKPYDLQPLHDLGIGNWSNILYFDLSD